MTKFMQQRFSVYANYCEPVCDHCQKESKTFYVEQDKRLCPECRQIEQAQKKAKIAKMLKLG